MLNNNNSSVGDIDHEIMDTTMAAAAATTRQLSPHHKLVENARKRIKLSSGDDSASPPDGIAITKSTDVLPDTGIQPFQAFDYRGSNFGIPLRLRKLYRVDVQNLMNLPRYDDNCGRRRRKDVSFGEFCHVDQYLSSDEFTVDLLTSKRYDDVVNAIVSYLLEWSDIRLDAFVMMFPKYDALIGALREFRDLDGGAYVYDYKGVPVVRTAIKIIKAHLDPKSGGQDSFDWMSLLEYDFVEHITQVYEQLRRGEPFTAEQVKQLEADMDIPFRLPNIDVTRLKQYDRIDNHKFITGEACCCKTTIVNKLTEMGWKKYSRGDVGSFNRKPENRASVANLHAALNFMLTKPDVIGDRSFIDNALWSFIMMACDPSNRDLIRMLFSFLNSNFNEPSIAEYIRHKGVVFIDPRSDKNKERQMKRCEDGDSWRSRLTLYPEAQFICYYVVARLFGWKVICVPYTETGNIDDVQYERNVERIVEFFGRPVVSGEPFVRFTKPSNLFEFNYEFPKSVGIYK